MSLLRPAPGEDPAAYRARIQSLAGTTSGTTASTDRVTLPYRETVSADTWATVKMQPQGYSIVGPNHHRTLYGATQAARAAHSKAAVKRFLRAWYAGA